MRKIDEEMAVNLFEIDYLQLCFSDLGSNYIKQSEITDIILYQNEIQVDKLRVNYHQRHLEKEWERVHKSAPQKVSKIKKDFAKFLYEVHLYGNKSSKI